MKIKQTFRSRVTSGILGVLGLAVGFAPLVNLDNKQASALDPWEADGWAQVGSGGEEHTCAVAVNGKAYCWGKNDYGQLGNNNTANTSTPVPVNTDGVLADKLITYIAAGDDYTCTIADGLPYCWGNNSNGQLGNNSTDESHVPVAVDTSGVLADKTVTSVSAGAWHTCVLADAQPYCWGANGSGQLGNSYATNDSSVPVAVDTSGALAGKAITSVVTGYNHTCALADGQAYCWGDNDNGQLGDSLTDDSPTPVAVDTSGVLAGKAVTALSASTNHTCVLADGQAYCWGYNDFGQLGNNSTDQSLVPVAVDTSAVLAGKTVTSISAGVNHTCALANGQPYCWGNNNHGELGDNSTNNSPVPVAVDTSAVLAGRTITSIATNGYHACVLANAGSYCWGWNRYGQLGNQSALPTLVPVAVVAKQPKQVTSVEFSQQGGKQLMTMHGAGLVGETNPNEYGEAVNHSLVSLNGTALPFCTDGTGYTAAFYISTYAGLGYDLTGLVSDDAPCYYLVNSVNAVLITPTQAIILLPTDFNTGAAGTVSVNGSPTFSFNQPTTTGPSNPPIVVNPPEAAKIEDKATVLQTTVSRSPIILPTKEGDSSNSATVATIMVEDKKLSDGHMVIDVRPTFKGKAPAGSTVTVTVHSDPVSCTATADNDGNWSCTLDRDLPEGRHTVRLSVVTPDNQIMNYGPYPVTVGTMGAVKDINAPSETFESAVAPASNFPLAAVVAGAAVLIAAVVTVIVIVRKRAV